MPTLALPAKLAAVTVAAAAMMPMPLDEADPPAVHASLGFQATAPTPAAVGFHDARGRYALANALGFGADVSVLAGARRGGGDEGLYARMNDGDVAMAAATLHIALDRAPSGSRTHWESGLSGHRGSIVPLGPAHRRDGRLCRDYRETLEVAGRTQSFTHLACRDGAGVWVWVE